jgi:hypothetical protein
MIIFLLFLPTVVWCASCALTIDNDLVYAITTYTFTYKPSVSAPEFTEMQFDFS